MRIQTMHIATPFGPTTRETAVCGKRGRIWMDEDWKNTDDAPDFRRCKHCEKTLGPGGLELLIEMRGKLRELRNNARRALGLDDPKRKRPSRPTTHLDDLDATLDLLLSRRDECSPNDVATIRTACNQVLQRLG